MVGQMGMTKKEYVIIIIQISSSLGVIENVALHVHVLVLVIQVILIIAMQILDCVWNVSVCMCGSEMVS